MIAQRVSAGFRPPINTQPREGRQNLPPRTPERDRLSIGPGHETDKPQSLEAAKVSVVADPKSPCFHRFEIRPISFTSDVFAER